MEPYEDGGMILQAAQNAMAAQGQIVGAAIGLGQKQQVQGGPIDEAFQRLAGEVERLQVEVQRLSKLMCKVSSEVTAAVSAQKMSARGTSPVAKQVNSMAEKVQFARQRLEDLIRSCEL